MIRIDSNFFIKFASPSKINSQQIQQPIHCASQKLFYPVRKPNIISLQIQFEFHMDLETVKCPDLIAVIPILGMRVGNYNNPGRKAGYPEPPRTDPSVRDYRTGLLPMETEKFSQ
jgi:hypothetical protein